MHEPDEDPLDDLQSLIAALGELANDSDSTGDRRDAEVATQRVAITAELRALADQTLHDAVEHARAHNVSWQQIGDVLGITRQAAFQRFRNPDDPRGARSMTTKNSTALIPTAEAVYHQLAADDYDSVARQMTFLVQRILNEKKVMSVWSGIAAMAGDLESLGESSAQASGSNVVVETPLHFEAGDFVGRIAYNRRNKITGLFIVRREDLSTAPF